MSASALGAVIEGAAPRRPRVPAVLLRLGRTLGVPVAEITRYWRQERRAVRSGAVALLVAAVADLGAGIVLISAEDRLAELPGLLLLIPAAIAMRGATFGAFGARLGTAIAIGTYEPELRPGTWLWRQVEAVTVLTLVTSVEAALLADVFAGALGRAALPLPDLIVISTLGGVLASVFLLVVTLGLARQASARDWNMDDVGAPAITATGDLLAIPALLLATVAARAGAVTGGLAVLVTVLTVVAVAYGSFHPREEIRRLVRESLVVLSGAATISVLAGVVLESREDVFLAIPALLLLFPPFIALFGSLGGILSSRLTSKLHLGLLEPTLVPGRLAALDVSLVVLFATGIYLFIGGAAWVAAEVAGTRTPALVPFVGVSLIGGLFGTMLLALVAYGAAAATYRFGLDPDNHAIPVVTSVMDFLGMLCLVGAVALLGLG